MTERKIIQVFDDGENIQEWSEWKRNYLANMHHVANGKDTLAAIDFYNDVVIYFREADSAVLSPSLHLVEVRPHEIGDAEPNDLRIVRFEGHQTRQDPEHFPSFRYSPSEGYEVPHAHQLGMPLTLDDLSEYTKYYTDGAGWQTFRTAYFDGYKLHDKRQSHYPPELKDAWAITRPIPGKSGELMAEREVLMVEGSWLPVDSKTVHFSFVNQYQEFTFKLKQAIKLLKDFTS